MDKMIDIKKIESCLVKQRYQSWCGLACISMICKYFNGDIPQEKLAKLSGTTDSGTTLLGLYQAAEAIGLQPAGLEGDMEELAKLNAPSVLHIISENGLQHYVVCWGMYNNQFILSDPASGIQRLSEEELRKLWVSKTLLLLKKSERFKEVTNVNKAKYVWIKELLRPDIKILLMVLILSIVFSVLGMSLALFSQKLVDAILPSKDMERLITGTIILAFLLFTKNLFGYYRTILSARQIRDFTNRIVGQFYSIILYLPKSFFDSLKAGEITARLNDASRIQQTINYISAVFLIDIISVIVITVVLFFYWWPVALLTILVSLCFSGVFLKNAEKIVKGQKRVMVDYAQSESFFFNSIQGIDVIKSYGKEAHFANAAKNIFSFFQNAVFDLNILGNKISFWTQNIAVSLIIAVILICSYGVFNDYVTLGELVAILAFSSTVLASVGSLMNAYFTYQEAKVAYNRLYEFVGMETECGGVETNDINPEEIITLVVKDLSFRYAGRPLVIKNVSFNAILGKITVIKGDIGSGKSTLLSILMRMYVPEEGHIYVGHTSIFNYPIDEWRKIIAVMPQDVKLFNTSLIENICLDLTEEKVRVAIELCKRYGIDKFFESLPMAYLTRIGEDGVNLSGGQQQMVGLSRALFHNPKILLLDEPTNNMDSGSIELFWKIIEQEKHKRIVAIVAHDERIIRRADNLVYL